MRSQIVRGVAPREPAHASPARPGSTISPYDAHVATQEYSDVPDQLPDPGPSLTLTVHPNGDAEGQKLRFHGDVARSNVEVTASTGSSRRHELADIDLPVVKAEISAWLTELLGRRD